MTWWRILLDSPLSIGLLCALVAICSSLPALFIGRTWGRSEASDILKRRLRDSQHRVTVLETAVDELETLTADMGDKQRTLLGYARRVAERFGELAEAPTRAEVARKRKAG